MNTKSNEEAFLLGFEKSKYGFDRHDLESKGERTVRISLKMGGYGAPGHPAFEYVSAWLADKEYYRSEAESAKQSAREAETLSIAREANRLASEANSIARLEAAAASRSARWAMYAAIIAAIGAIIAIKDHILELIFGNP